MDPSSSMDLMVREQLIARGIRDHRVLAAFRKVPRELFVRNEFLESAYDDHPLPIGEGQTISQPYMVALMTECLNLNGGEKVLEIGSGSGYQAAILAELSKEVYSVERIPALARYAQENIAKLGYKNIHIKVGDGTEGWEEQGPFAAIIVTAGAPSVPKSLVAQLGEKGRLVLPVGGSFCQMLTIIKKDAGKVISEEICGCVFVPLIGKEGWRA